MKNLIIVIIAIIGLFLVTIVYQLLKFFSVSKGEKIIKYQNPKTALLVLDLQKEFSDLAEKIIDNVNLAIETINSNNGLVVYIKTEYEPTDYILNFIRKNKALKGSTQVDFIDKLKIVSNNIFFKNRMDAFSNKKLSEFLVQNQVEHLIICGLDGRYCVFKTTLAALNRGYKVTLLSDAIISKDIEKLESIKNKLKEKGVNFLLTNQIKNFL